MKHAAALLLALSLLLSLFACGKTQNPAPESDPAPTDTAEPVDTPAEDTTADDGMMHPNVPEITFGGAEFHILQHGYSFEYIAEEIKGEQLNDAIYNRNIAIEDRYEVKITAETGETDYMNPGLPMRRLDRDVMAGETSYQMIAEGPLYSIRMAQAGNLHNLNTVPYLDPSQPWWDQNTINAFTFGGKLYFMSGSYVLHDKSQAYAVFFNHEMADDFHLPDLYEIALGGKWTMDLMTEYSAAVTNDLDGDGWIDPSDDRYGTIFASGYCVPPVLIGMGFIFSSMDAEGNPSVRLSSEHNVNVIEKFASLVDYSITGWSRYSYFKDQGSDFVFLEKRALFYVSVVAQLGDGFDFEYGILPLPKYDEDQQRYMTTAEFQYAATISIPVTITGETLEMTGILLEALSAYSHTTTLPTYINSVMELRRSPDKESTEVLRILYSNIVHDFIYDFNLNKLPNAVRDLLIYDKGEGYISLIASDEAWVEQDIRDVLDTFAKLP